MRKIKFLLAILVSIAVAACGGGGGGDPPPPPATISGTVTGAAGVTINLTGASSATATTDGSYSFAGLANGSYTVTPSKTGFSFSPVSTAVSVSGANVPGTNFTATATVNGSISGIVTNAANSSGVPGVLVSAGSATATTDSNGAYTLSGASPASSVIVSFAKAGFVPQNRTTTDYTTTSSLVQISVPMLAVAHTQTFNPAVAQTIIVPGSTAQVTLPAGGLRTASGGAPVGQVTAQVTPIAPASNLGTMPGNYLASQSGSSVPIESFGAINVRFTDESGNALTNLASGTSTIRIPVSALAGQTLTADIPLFFFNTSTGLWVQEGMAELMGTAPNQYYQGTVNHFSFWNADRVLETVTVTSCVADVNNARVTGASVTSRGTNYTGTSSTTTDANGDFTVKMKSNATVSIQAVKGGVVSEVRPVTTLSANLSQPTCLKLEPATLTIAKAGTGTGTVIASPAGPTYPAGTVVTLTQASASGSYFAGWTGACSRMGSCVVTMDASKSVTATFNPVDPSTAGGVAQAKAFFSDLRLTLNLFANGSQTGLLDKQLKRIQNDLVGKTATNLGTFMERAAALDTGSTLFQQVTNGSWNASGYLMRYFLEPGSVSGTVRVATWSSFGGGGEGSCYTNDFTGSTASAVSAAGLTKVTCKVMDWNGSTWSSTGQTESYILINMTGSVGTMAYDARAYSRSSGPTGWTTPVATSDSYTGTFTSTRDSNYKLTQLAINGDFPGSQAGIAKDRLALTFGTTATTATTGRWNVSGTVTSYDANNISMAALGISSGSYVDVDANSKPTLVHMVGTAQTTATSFTGTLHMDSVMSDADGRNRIPTSVTFTGVISDTSSGGASDFLTGVLAVTVTNYNQYRSSLPESNTNLIKLGATFTGTIGFPNVQVQPIRLVLDVVRTGLTTANVSVNFTYDNGKSIAGTAVMDSTLLTNVITLTQGSLTVTLGGPSVAVMVGGVLVATISGNMIYYVDNTFESLI